LILHSKDAGKFELGTRPIPTPGAGQLLIKILAAALNPVDVYIQKVGYIVDRYGFPAVPGSDGAGVVEEIGEGVQGWTVGDRVLFPCFWVADRGTLQQYAIADAIRTAKIPTGLSFDEASTIPLGLATAAFGLYGETIKGNAGPGGGIGLLAPWEDGKGKYKNQPILILGGSSSVGQFALQLAKLSGFSPIITTASKRNEAYCKSAGATHVIDYHDVPYSKLPKAVEHITREPISVVYDAVSTAESQPAGWRVLAPNGSMVVTLGATVGKPGQRVEDDSNKLVVWCYGNANEPANHALGTKLYAELPGLLRDGLITPNAVEVVPDGLASAFSGLEHLARGVSGIKLVVHPNDNA